MMISNEQQSENTVLTGDHIEYSNGEKKLFFWRSFPPARDCYLIDLVRLTRMLVPLQIALVTDGLNGLLCIVELQTANIVILLKLYFYYEKRVHLVSHYSSCLSKTCPILFPARLPTGPCIHRTCTS